MGNGLGDGVQHARCLLGTAFGIDQCMCVRDEGVKQNLERQMFSCDAVSTKASVNLMGNTTAQLTLQNYPEVGQVGQVFISLCWSVTGGWLAMGRGVVLGETVFFN